MEILKKILKDFKLLTIFAKKFILDILLSSKYALGLMLNIQSQVSRN